MRLVVADTSPICYLEQIGLIEGLYQLFGKVLLPSAVAQELLHPSAPAGVRQLMSSPPEWIDVVQVNVSDPDLESLDPGERSAIQLAIAVSADAILIDERDGTAAAAQRGLKTIGTIGVIDRAARAGLVDVREAVARLKRTNFRYPPALLDVMLDAHNRE
jgi:predicted nucleic acid-binding protein